MNLETILKTIDERHGLSVKYPDQLFDVTSRKDTVVFHSTTGEMFHTFRSSLSDTELSILDSELNEASKRNMTLIYRTYDNLDEFDEDIEDQYFRFDEEEDWDISISNKNDAKCSSVWEDLRETKYMGNKIDVLQRLDVVESRNKKLRRIRRRSKKGVVQIMVMLAHKFPIQPNINIEDHEMDELNENLQSMNIIRFDTSVGHEKEDRKRKNTHEMIQTSKKQKLLN